jgi:molybdopterin-guanine dinucleotide biosynthesis protein A
MFSVVIQAGGRSIRMRRNKALILLNGTPLIEHVIQRFSSLTDDLIIISPHLDGINRYGYTTHTDIGPGKGPLMGLYTGLFYAKYVSVAVIACDMPFANPELILEEVRLMAEKQCDVVIPFLDGKSEPFHAVYKRIPCLKAIERGISVGMQRLIDWHSDVQLYQMGEEEIRRFDSRGLAFFNINTPEDLADAEEIINQADW